MLLVDDEEVVTQGLSRFVCWEETGFSVSGTALSVSDALAQLEKEPANLVITDIQMPGQNGLDLIRILKERYPKIKTILLSGYSDFAYAQQAVRLGALDYLTKPINFCALKKLLEQVRETLDKETQCNGQDAWLQELLCHTLILNIANGFPFDEARAATCLDIHCPIRAIRLSLRKQAEISPELVRQIKEHFAPCQVVLSTAEELLCVTEGSRDAAALLWSLSELSLQKPPLCVGISEEVLGYKQLRLASLQASKALRYQKTRSEPGVLLYNQVREMFANSVEAQDTTIRRLIENFSDPEKRSLLIEDFSAALSALENRADFSLALAHHFCTEFLVELDAPIQTLLPTESCRHIMLSEVLMDVLGADSIPEIRNYISHYLERLFAILREQDETRQAAELIDRVKNYIQEHFAENLTLTVLSELFYICPAYLSRLFKKKTGVNFVEYLTNLRIKKGKEFLADPSLMIYTVSEMVGYENPRYFSRLFKESVGCSPQEYRNKLQ
ncbi:MAG: response regulator [Oscillospiraceae bacterium]